MASTAFNYPAMRSVADNLMLKFGMKASLVRGNPPAYRDCWVAMTDYFTKDAASQLSNPTDRQVFISAGLGAVPGQPPDFDLDQLVTYNQPASNPPVQDEVLPFIMPIKLIAPAGIVVLYQTTVRR